MPGRLAGKTALVTAAGQGMGFACAMQMAAEGATVHATDVDPKLLAAFKGVANVTTRPLDVLDDVAVRRTIDELPPLDVLFNCAGYVHHGSILDCTPKDLRARKGAPSHRTGSCVPSWHRALVPSSSMRE